MTNRYRPPWYARDPFQWFVVIVIVAALVLGIGYLVYRADKQCRDSGGHWVNVGKYSYCAH